MFNSLCRIGLTAALLGLLFVPGMAVAQDKRVRHVEDNAKLFNKEAVESANAIIAKIKEKHKKDLLIETVAEGPKKDKLASWAKERFNNAAVDGVDVVLDRKPKGFQVDVGDQTLNQGYFLRSDIRELEKIIDKKGEDKELLSEIATYVLETFNERHKTAKVAQPEKKKAAVPAPRDPVVHEPVVHNNRENAMPPWVGWVCMIVAVLFVVWIIYAVIRAMTSAHGQRLRCSGGGFTAAAAGGFFTGMLGGLFGAMAGMWIYNSMFGGHAAYRSDGSVDWGGGGGAAGGEAPYQGDTDVGASGGGDGGDGEWGGGGGDAGGGGGGEGGDWGGKGGGDEGGGGDWGGGGDAGGGGDGGAGGGGAGGGDWGGGGGGDWGGGAGGGEW